MKGLEYLISYQGIKGYEETAELFDKLKLSDDRVQNHRRINNASLTNKVKFRKQLLQLSARKMAGVL